MITKNDYVSSVKTTLDIDSRVNFDKNINNNRSIYSQTKQITIAYFILVHRFPEQFKRLFKAIFNKENHYLIHLDKKSDKKTCDEVKLFLRDFPNAHILDSENVVWGGYSMVQSELNGIKFLLDIDLKWDFFINLSGQDFPLKSQEIIRNFLTKK
jgi:hypothetical protein